MNDLKLLLVKEEDLKKMLVNMNFLLQLAPSQNPIILDKSILLKAQSYLIVFLPENLSQISGDGLDFLLDIFDYVYVALLLFLLIENLIEVSLLLVIRLLIMLEIILVNRVLFAAA